MVNLTWNSVWVLSVKEWLNILTKLIGLLVKKSFQNYSVEVLILVLSWIMTSKD